MFNFAYVPCVAYSETCSNETHYTYTPSDARATRALCGDDVSAVRAPRVRGVEETPWGTLGVHVAHFRPMCLTAWNSLRPPKRPIMARTGPTRFDAWVYSQPTTPVRDMTPTAEHTRATSQGPLGPPAPRGPRVEPRGARKGHNRALRGA